MSLTNRERNILDLANQGLSDYKIARKIKIDPAITSRTHKNARKKLADALKDIEWATKIGLNLSQYDADTEENL